MYIILKSSWAMIKRKKMQSILISIIVILIAMLLYISITMITLSSPAKIMFARANATENLLILDNNIDPVDHSQAWWNNQEAVDGTIVYSGHMATGNFIVDEKTETETIMITEFEEQSDYDLMYSTSYQLAIAPIGNEILLNYNFANDRDLIIGDTIQIVDNNRSFEFVVSGFLVDPQYSNPFINVDRCFVEKGFFEKTDFTADYSLLGIKYKEISNVNDYAMVEDYKNSVGAQPIFLDYYSLLSSYNIITGIIAAILFMVSIFIFAIVIFVIRATVRNIILQQYKQLGVKKVLGYSNKQIRCSFLCMYGVLGFISSVIGSFLGIPIRNYINTGISYDLQVGLHSGFDIYLVITVILVVLLLSLFTLIATKEVSQIKPVQAIKYGMPERKITTNTFQITKSKILPLSLLLSIKQILVNKKKAITTTLTITILIYVAFLISATGNTIGNEEHFVKNIFGYQVGDYTFVNNSKESVNDVLAKLDSVDTIRHAVYGETILNRSTSNFDDSEQLSLLEIGIFGDYPKDGINLAQGRAPSNKKEVVISSDMAKKTGKTTGDYIVISSDTDDFTYFICGIIHTVNNGGLMYLTITEDLPENMKQNSGIYWIFSNEKHVILEEATNTIENLLGTQVSVTHYDSNVKNVLSTVEMFPLIINSLLLIFLLVCGVIILNFTIIDINHSTKVFGVMKTIGYSNSSITKTLLIRSILLTSFGIVIGFSLNMLTANAVMRGIFKITPFSFIEMTVLFDGFGSLVLPILFLAIAIIATLIPAKRVNKISPKMLICE